MCIRDRRWKLSLPVARANKVLGCFSPKGQFIVVVLNCYFSYVLDVFSGNVCLELSMSHYHSLLDFKFISDEEIVILSYHSTSGVSLRLFSVRSGDMLSVLQVYSSDKDLFLATCPGEGLVAIYPSCKPDLSVIV